MKRLLLLGMLLTACSDASGPKGLDPIVLAHNNQGTYPASITWLDQSGQVQATVLPAFSTTCVKFISTRVADSVRFEIVVGDTTGQHGSWTKQWSPWFDPTTGVTGASPGEYPYGAEYWRLTISPSPGILMKTDSVPPC